MIPSSIRWRLPLSYAGIALLAALLLGAVLITTLRSYYRQLELEELTSSAAEFSLVTSPFIAAGVPTTTLQSHVDGFSFVAQARVRLRDADERVLADSGVPDRAEVAFGAVALGPPPPAPGEFVEFLPNTLPPDVLTVIRIGDAPLPAGGWLITSTAALTPSPAIPFTSRLAITPAIELSFVSTPFGFSAADGATYDRERSDQVVRTPIMDAQGHPIGYVELSEGPAYGREIVESVAGGWAIAGGVAVALAAVAGLLISRHLSAPLLALNAVTTRMAEGDLSTRANVTRRDEFGELAQSFNAMAERVESTVVALRRFVADAAHELRTPLTALRTDLELMAADPHAPRTDSLKRAQAQIHRLESLTSSLLDLSQIEAGEVQPNHHLLNLVDVVRQVSEPYASQAEQAGIAFAVDVPEADVAVQGDEEQLRRALGNLLDNAIKFTPEGGAVRVGAGRAGEHIELWVEDSGIGIPTDDLPQLFNRFHRGRNASAYAGNGLGLAIVRAIVNQHNGQVIAENVGPGARFAIRLPIASSVKP